MRKVKVKNFVTGRWVLTVKFDKDGTFSKCKARWVLRGFQDQQKDYQQTDSPTATRPGFRLTCQQAACRNWNLMHVDLKTAFLQGEAFDETRDIVCQLPPEAGQPPWIGARMVKPAYGLNDAPRRWWNVIDGALLHYGMTPTRADRCCYVYYSSKEKSEHPLKSVPFTSMADAVDYLTDPVSGSPAVNKNVHGVLCLHVDDLFMAGDDKFMADIYKRIVNEFAVGSEDLNNIEFVGLFS